jgi:crotonobetainyl-CoA:carnitine CoA-transferase CaiB-like acyl-CoA transferase
MTAKDFQPDQQGPLAGVRVLDLSRLVSGNILSLHLADFGAEVVKVERPGHGDDLRNWKTAGIPAWWKVYARNKKSISLNLRSPEGADMLKRLVPGFHVLVENFRPGTLEGWGLGPDTLLALNPKLVIVRVSGWGQTGPYRDRPGFGSLIEGMSGFAARNGFGDRPPVLPPLALSDMVAAMQGAFATLAALRHIETGGGAGQVIDLSLFEPMFGILGPIAADYAIDGRVPHRIGSRSEEAAPRNVYECKDGKFLALSGSMQSMAERIFDVIGRPELKDDPRFLTNTDRLAHNDELDAIIADYMRQKTAAENLETFAAAKVTIGPILDISDLVDHPFIAGREVLVDLPDEDLGRVPMHNISPRLSATPGGFRRPAPEIGEHNAEIFAEIGVGDADLAALAQRGVV